MNLFKSLFKCKLWLLIPFSIILCCISRDTFSGITLIMVAICLMLTNFIKFFNKITTSLRTFLLYGVFSELILTNLLFIVINNKAATNKHIYDFIVQYVLTVLTITISWSIVSYIANNKIAKLANIILSTAMGLMIYVKDAIFDVLPDSLFQKYDSSNILIKVGYTPKGIVQAGLNYALLPFLISNIIATLVCEIKGYWIDKYNDDKDITMEMIKEDINEKEIHSSNESVEKSREKLEQTQANIKMQMNIIDNLLARGFKLSEALELAELDEEVYNKFKAEK